MKCWAMRTSRESDYRKKVASELKKGLFRQGWGWDKIQDLGVIQEKWANQQELTEKQVVTSKRIWKMGNGSADDGYMQVGDLIIVMNMLDYGFFTICQVTDDYYFEILEDIGDVGDLGHVRPVKVLTPKGVSNKHKRVSAGLRGSFKCQLPMWNVSDHQASLESIIRMSEVDPDGLLIGSDPLERIESIVSQGVSDSLDHMVEGLAENLPKELQAQEWETVLQVAMEPLFQVRVDHTAGPKEEGVDLEIVIPNPFDENLNWYIAVQVKDYNGEVGVEVVEQLKTACQKRPNCIGVVLLVSNARASKSLEDRMGQLSKEFNIPFIFCGHDQFMRILARGFFRRS